MNRTISAPRRKNKLHFWIIHCLLQVTQPLFHCSAETSGFKQSMFGNYRTQAPILQYRSRILHDVAVNLSSRGKNDGFIVVLQRWRTFAFYLI